MIRRTRTTVRTSVTTARRIRTVPAAKVDNTEAIQKQLQTIAKIDRQMEDLLRNRAAAEEEVKVLFAAGADEVVSDGIYEVKEVTPQGRSSTTVDPLKFKKVAGEEAFWKCCKVGVTEAKTFLSEKEMTRVTTVVEGKPGKTEVVISKIKKKGK